MERDAKPRVGRSTTGKPRRWMGATRQELQERAAAQEVAASDGVAAVDRALTILGSFKPGDQALSLAELAHRTNLYKSTILRIAQSLLRQGYLQRLDSGLYQIGPAPLILGALYQRSVRLGDILLSLMRDIADQTGESVSLYVRNGDFRVCLHRVDSRHAVRDHVREGDVLPLERGSGGRVLLAFGGAKGEPYETIRREYCHASVGERDAETAGISVPVFGAGQALRGALTLAGPRSRIDGTFIANARALLLRAAIRGTSSLGGDTGPMEAALAAVLAGRQSEVPGSQASR